MDYKDQQIEIYRSILRQSTKPICEKICRSVIKNCQQIEADILGDAGLKSLWEEIAIIVDEGEGCYFGDCLSTLSDFIREAIDQAKLAEWQQNSLWLMTSEGLDWLYSDQLNEKVCWCEADVVRMIRDDYLVPAAMDWTNHRIRRYNDSKYE